MGLFSRLNAVAGRRDARASLNPLFPKTPLYRGRVRPACEASPLGRVRDDRTSNSWRSRIFAFQNCSRSRILAFQNFHVPKFSCSRRRTLRVDLLGAMFLDIKRLHSEVDLGRSAPAAPASRDEPARGQRARERPGACARGGCYERCLLDGFHARLVPGALAGLCQRLVPAITAETGQSTANAIRADNFLQKTGN